MIKARCDVVVPLGTNIPNANGNDLKLDKVVFPNLESPLRLGQCLTLFVLPLLQQVC